MDESGADASLDKKYFLVALLVVTTGVVPTLFPDPVDRWHASIVPSHFCDDTRM